MLKPKEIKKFMKKNIIPPAQKSAPPKKITKPLRFLF
jgi:hypothetical protein